MKALDALRGFLYWSSHAEWYMSNHFLGAKGVLCLRAFSSQDADTGHILKLSIVS